MRRLVQCALVVGLLIGAAPVAASTNDAPVAQQTGDITRPIDELWADIGEMVPEFGGVFHSEEKRALMIHVTAQRPGLAEDLKTALESVFNQATLDGLYLDNIVLLDARYSMLQLIGWRDRLRGGMWSVPGVTSLGFQTMENRLGVSVEHPDEQKAAVEKKLDELGIPRDAVIIEQGGPIIPQAGRSADDSRKTTRLGWWLGGAGALILIVVAARMVLARRARTSSVE
jgi:hypothetical protein